MFQGRTSPASTEITSLLREIQLENLLELESLLNFGWRSLKGINVSLS
jgi:hypothetical protein